MCWCCLRQQKHSIFTCDKLKFVTLKIRVQNPYFTNFEAEKLIKYVLTCYPPFFTMLRLILTLVTGFAPCVQASPTCTCAALAHQAGHPAIGVSPSHYARLMPW
jgi:hypothetical protein